MVSYALPKNKYELYECYSVLPLEHNMFYYLDFLYVIIENN